MGRLTISALGSIGLDLDGRPLAGLDYKKVRALLVLLAVEADRAHTRAELCGQLWPDVDERAARASLSQAISQLRLVLGDKEAATPFLLVTPEAVQLNPDAPIRIDVAEFLAAIQQAERHRHHAWHTCGACAGRLQHALTLYRGDFLDHFFLNDSAPFEEWTVIWRERLKARALSALERLIARAEWCGDFATAVGHALRMVSLDPLSETAQSESIRLLALNGEQAAAEAQYEHHRRVWADELGLDPDPATLRLLARVRAGERQALRRIGPAPASRAPTASPMVGRVGETEALLTQVRSGEARVITLIGAPGIGKTRLALQVAEDLRYDFEHGVFVIELAPLDRADMVPAAIAATLGVKEQGRQSLTERLHRHVADKHLLLVLDNFEHVLEAAVDVAGLVNAGPEVTVLVTSRAPLRIRAEQPFPMVPLSAPDARALFMARAGLVEGDAASAPGQDAAIGAICARVDHLPLAIELVASRARTVSLEDLGQQLARGLDALGPGLRDLPERQQTLWASIAWSYDRLPEAVRAVFATVSVFAGGFSAEAALAVAGHAAPEALDRLGESSLIQVRTGAGETRFDVLETLREFGRERLSEDGAAERVHERHAAFFETLADQAYTGLLNPDQGRWGQRLSTELDNLRAAVSWAQAHGQNERVLRIATGVFRFFWQRGLMREGLRWFEPALADNTVKAEVRSRAQRAAGVLAWALSDYSRARRLMEDAIATGRAAADADLVASATTNLGLVLKEQGEWALASERLAEAVRLNRALAEDPHRVKFALNVRAGLLTRLGEWSEAERAYMEALEHNRAVGDVEGTANSLYGLGLCAGARGQQAQARVWMQESLNLYAGLHHQYGVGQVHLHLGNLELEVGSPDAARGPLMDSAATWLEREDASSLAHVFDSLARLLALERRWEQAGQLLSAADRLRAEANALLTPYEQTARAAFVTTVRDALGPDAFEATLVTGRALTPRRALALVKSGQ